MNEVRYTIYHAFNIKVGCTMHYPHRCYRQGFKDEEFGPLKELNFDKRTPETDQIAKVFERFYQRLYNYPIDNISYEGSIKGNKRGGKIGSKIGGKRTSELMKTGFQTATSKQKSEYAKVSAASPNHATKQIRTCQRCGLTMKGISWLSHIKNGTRGCPL